MHEALDRLVEEVVVLAPSRPRRRCSGDLPPSSSVTGIRFWLAYCMISRPVVVSPVKAILAIAVRGRQRLAGLEAEAVDDVEHARRQQVADQLDQNQDRGRRLLGRLQHHAVAGGQRRRELPDRHQDREVPRDDLADDAERLVEVIGDGVVVDLARSRLPAPGSRRRSSGNGRWRAECRPPSSRGSACRCPRSRPGRAARGSPPSGRRSCSGSPRAPPRWCAPQASLAACAASSAASTSAASERATSQSTWPFTGERLSKYLPAPRLDALAADEVAVALLERRPSPRAGIRPCSCCSLPNIVAPRYCGVPESCPFTSLMSARGPEVPGSMCRRNATVAWPICTDVKPPTRPPTTWPTPTGTPDHLNAAVASNHVSASGAASRG